MTRPSAEISLYFFDDVLVEVPMSGPELIPLNGLRFWSRGGLFGQMAIAWKETDAKDERRTIAQRAAKEGGSKSLESAVRTSRTVHLPRVTTARLEKARWRMNQLVLEGRFLPRTTHVYRFFDSDHPGSEVASVLRELLGDRFTDARG